MTEERITERDDGVTTERTVERGTDDSHTVVVERRSGAGMWVLALVILVAIGAGIYVFNETNAREAVETEALTDAASEVGDAARNMGDAAQQAGDAAEEAVDGMNGE
ncbi:hypothetical protein [Parasphingopyxis marina]|uniref:Uncharacterized protein n=1 Tax=Parasphingopyxis marina TaxID=2761622 RepID=A0A842HZ75_9SPHN|nr:hypothetical protein [Parasphingopyxis marina]MBC2777659.1 hypothetical protein [Parasphingopyxis marina]